MRSRQPRCDTEKNRRNMIITIGGRRRRGLKHSGRSCSLSHSDRATRGAEPGQKPGMARQRVEGPGRECRDQRGRVPNGKGVLRE